MFKRPREEYDSDSEDGECSLHGRGLSLIRKLRDIEQGSVFLGIDEKSSENVVVKRYSRECVQHKQSLSQMPLLEDPEQEIEVLAKLSGKHPNLVSLNRFFYDQTWIYVVMECVSGGDLCDFLQLRSLSFGETALLFKQLLSVVDFLHVHGIAHLDISPENILLKSDKKSIKLIDFGLAKMFVPDERRAVFKHGRPGKIRYMAPELFWDGKCDVVLADAYSCGIVLYNMVLASYPYAIPGDKSFQKFFGSSAKELRERCISRLPCSSSCSCTRENANVEESPCYLYCDLLSCLVARDKNRVTVSKALQHPFLKISKDS
jgi:serine/threonine protein kinase